LSSRLNYTWNVFVVYFSIDDRIFLYSYIPY